MHCPACDTLAPPDAGFCPRCGAALVPPTETSQPDRSISGAATEPGTWFWLLLVLVGAERLTAWLAFPIDESIWLASGWERPFLWIWGGGLGVLALIPLALKKRWGGWVAALSGLALSLRACVPMLSEGRSAEQQVYGAVCALMVASATLTFAFLYEQSYWAKTDQEGGNTRD